MKIIKWLTGVFILLLILIVVISNLGLGFIYFPFIYKVPGLDKVGHFFLMGVLSFLVNYLLKAKKIELLSQEFLYGSLVVFLIVFLEELSQLFLIYRAFSMVDLIFDIGGIFLGGRLAAWLLKKLEN
jgi:polysaccharide biosynthesis protein VpsQ